MPLKPKIKKNIIKTTLDNKKLDAVYWRERSYKERLSALEEIRHEYHKWEYGGETRIQKVVKIIHLNNYRHQDLDNLENLE